MEDPAAEIAQADAAAAAAENEIPEEKDAREETGDAAGIGGVEKADEEEMVEEEGVFVVEENHARFRPVRTGIAGEKDFEVLEGLESGEVVVTGDFKALRELEDGDRVEVKETKKEEE